MVMTRTCKRKNSVSVMLEKLQKSLSQVKKGSSRNTSDRESIPKDVKEGHFALVAVHDNEERRFVIPVSYLTQPPFVRLLEKAAEEYGFDHKGAIMIPCSPSLLESILADQQAVQRRCKL